jgi:hypothetical protein
MFLMSPGIAVAYVLISAFISIMGLFFMSVIPLLGSIAATTIQLALIGGFFVAGHGLYRGRKVSLSEYFGGFSMVKEFVLITLMLYGMLVLLFIPLGLGTYLLADIGGTNNFAEYFWIMYIGVLGFVLALGLLAAIVYPFALANTIHLYLKAWGAMELSRRVVFKSFGRVALLVIQLFILNVAGGILFGLGLLITIPITFFAIQVAWEQLIGKQAVPHFDQLIDEFGNDDAA